MYRAIFLPHFLQQLGQLAKKYFHLRDAVGSTLDAFQKDRAISLGNRLYKLRVASKDIPRGKSKSFRLIVLLLETDSSVVPITLYFKGDRQDMAKREMNDHLQVILLELESYKP